MSDGKTTIVGIDLGTTYSCIAHVDDVGRPVVLKNSEGHNTTPSVVFFESEENVVVGRTAKNATATDPDKVISFMKRNMGDGQTTYEVDGRSYRPETVSSFVLKRLVKDAAESLQCPITDVVITVPAYFGENERAATEQAGKIAGFNVRSIINEPTAAAICYGIDKMEEGTVLVYDLGGGTFDVTMIEVRERKIEVICTGGNHELGGKDWDERLMNYFVSQWAEQQGQSDFELDSERDKETLNELRLLAEEKKQELSAREKLTLNVRIEGERAKLELTREKFDELTANLLQLTIDLTKKMLEDARAKGYTKFSKILLVGGSTRMPQVQKRLEQEFNVPIEIFDPDESVAKGAALYAQRLQLKGEVEEKVEEKLEGLRDVSPDQRAAAEEQAVKEVARNWALPAAKVDQLVNTQVTNVASKAFGVVALNDQEAEEVVFLIPRNQSLPADTTMPFGTSADRQRSADIKIMEGENERATQPGQCNEIGKATLDLPAGLPKGSPIEITFRMNENGMLEATAKEMTQGGTVQVTIERGDFVMNDEQVAETRLMVGRKSVS